MSPKAPTEVKVAQPVAADAPAASPIIVPTANDDDTLDGIRRFIIGIAPGALLLLGSLALLGSGSFLDALRAMRS